MWISLKMIFFSEANFLSAHLSTFLLLVLPLIATATVNDWEGDAWLEPVLTGTAGLGSRYEVLKKKSIYFWINCLFQKLLGASKTSGSALHKKFCNASSRRLFLSQSHLGDKSGQHHNWNQIKIRFGLGSNQGTLERNCYHIGQ